MAEAMLLAGKSATTHTENIRLYVLAFAVVVAAEFIGIVNVPVGLGNIVLLPLLWALLIGGVWSLAENHLPGPLRIGTALQRRASAIVQLALLLLAAKLGLLVGGSLPKLAAAGWALLFQEFGHFFGTMAIGLPIALLFGIKREAIGATFSVGREPSLAIIAEKYGMHSPEGRGVLAEYITGTLFGTVFMSILASLITSLNIFNPLSLAMGAGVGSASMMTAASGVIAAQQPSDLAKDVFAFAAASNLMTTIVGLYFTLYISLPFTVWAYNSLEPVIGRTTKASTQLSKPIDAPDHLEYEAPRLSNAGHVLAWVFAGAFALVGNWITYKTAPDPAVLGGMALILGVVLAGYGMHLSTRAKVPAVVCVSLLGIVATYPDFPMAATVVTLTGKINFLALTTPILAFAGLSIAKDMPAFRRLGWRIVVTSLSANAGTFIAATVIAQCFFLLSGAKPD
jgi:Protein of unknown function (DUF3100)